MGTLLIVPSARISFALPRVLSQTVRSGGGPAVPKSAEPESSASLTAAAELMTCFRLDAAEVHTLGMLCDEPAIREEIDRQVQEAALLHDANDTRFLRA